VPERKAEDLFWLVGAAMGAAAVITSIAHRIRADHRREHWLYEDRMSGHESRLYKLERRVAAHRKQRRHRVLPDAERRHHVDA